MRQSTDAGHFFQSDAAISESARKSEKAKNEAGGPIRLPSKLLAVIADPFDDGAVYVAEAAGTVKRIALETSTITHTLRPSTSNPNPITCLTLSAQPNGTGTLFAGSWDKIIYSWPISSSLPAATTATASLAGHTDFIKAILVIPPISSNQDALLVSASADKSLIVWNTTTSQKLHVLTNHSRGVQALALDPLSQPDPLAPSPSDASVVVIASGDSSREIRFWRISATSAAEISAKHASADPPQTSESSSSSDGPTDDGALLAHETSIYALTYTSSGDLWTASADKSAKRLARMQAFAADTELAHGDYVKAVAVSEAAGLVVTAGRDEHVRVWEAGSGRCVATLRGHWEEVTGLALVRQDRLVVSVGIDGTIRRWGLAAVELQREIDVFGGDIVKEEKENLLTEDEERELAELMEDDD